MAWFTPPLTKPGNHKCPCCGERLWPWGGGAWVSQWRCHKCQSLLEWERPRHYVACLLAFLVNCALVAVNVWMPDRPVVSVTGLVVRLAVAIMIILFIFWWLTSISPVVEQEPVDSRQPSDKPPGAA